MQPVLVKKEVTHKRRFFLAEYISQKMASQHPQPNSKQNLYKIRTLPFDYVFQQTFYNQFISRLFHSAGHFIVNLFL